jgi:hypothetical protein
LANYAQPRPLQPNWTNRLSVNLYVGRWFSLDDLSVMASDSEGKRLPPVPLMIEVDEGARALLDLRPEMTLSNKMLAVHEGTFRFRIRTACPGASVPMFVQATVRK